MPEHDVRVNLPELDRLRDLDREALPASSLRNTTRRWAAWASRWTSSWTRAVAAITRH